MTNILFNTVILNCDCTLCESVSQKMSLLRLAITLTYRNWFWQFLEVILLQK